MAYVGNTYTTQGFTPAIDYFSGNASTTAFTLSRPVASVAQVQVTIENVPQNPGSAFTVSGNTITFTSAPPTGTNNIYVYYTSPITQVVALPQSPQVFGNLQFSSTGARITGDFSNATLANRVAFQSSTTNGETSLVVIPNGTSTTTRIQLGDASNLSGSGNFLNLFNTGSEVSIRAGTYSGGSGLPMTFYTNGSERMRIDTSGNFQFNSGYGSVATAYGCRAWVNFNGTGTVAIRASGNVSSITDTNTGRYVVNFTNAMPDANYCALAVVGASLYLNPSPASNGANTTTACSISVVNVDPTSAGGYTDASDVSVSIFR